MVLETRSKRKSRSAGDLLLDALQAADDPAVGEGELSGLPLQAGLSCSVLEAQVVARTFISTKRVAFHSLYAEVAIARSGSCRT